MAALQDSRLCLIARHMIYDTARSTGQSVTARDNQEAFQMFAPEVTRPVPLGSVTTFRVVSVLQRTYDALASWQSARVTSRNAIDPRSGIASAT